MKILCDFHHGGLFASYHYLLERRLGHEVYRPAGLAWFEHGYWDIGRPYPDPSRIARELLAPLEASADGVHQVWDPTHGYHQKAIELDTFRQTAFDIVIASIPSHVPTYRKLLDDIGSKAALIYQLGNIGWHQSIPWALVRNVMASVAPFRCPAGTNAVFYRQEFDLDVFKPSDVPSEPLIASFLNCMPSPNMFTALESLLPGFSFESYGIACRDGVSPTIGSIAGIMQRARFGYHIKPGGDGFGHVLHNWCAVGKPLIVGCDDYRDTLGDDFLTDGVTCIDTTFRTMRGVANIVSSMSEVTYRDMCTAVQSRFLRLVDFERDAANVRAFLERSL